MQEAVQPHWEVPQAVARGRERRRRARVLKSVIALGLTAVALCVVVTWQRNSVRLADARERFEQHLPGLRETLRLTGVLPLVYPPREPGGKDDAPAEFNYVDSVVLRRLRLCQEPIIVAYSSTVPLALGPDQQVVAIRDGAEIRVTVIRADRLRRRLAEQQRRAQAAWEAQETSP